LITDRAGFENVNGRGMRKVAGKGSVWERAREKEGKWRRSEMG
jgi:hypothetical protein